MHKRNQFKARFMRAPDSESTETNGGAPDRGDDFVPPSVLEEQRAAAEAKRLADEEAAKKAAAAGDEDDKTKTADELAEELETEEERAEREEAERKAAEEAEKAKRQRIPLTRHQEILEKTRREAQQREEELRQQLEQLRAAAAKTEETRTDPLQEMRKQIDEMQEKWEELVFEGKKDDAKKVRVELDQLRDKYYDTKVALTSQATQQATIARLEYQHALAKVESDYPELNPDGEAYDSAKADEIAALIRMFQSNGLTPLAALERSVKYVMGPKKQAAATATDDVAVLRQRREQEARKKAAETAAKQPPDTSKAGQEPAGSGAATAINVMKLTREGFSKLDEATLSRLRGDEL